MKPCNVHSPERGASSAAKAPLWTQSAFITARLCGSTLTLVPYLFLKSPKEMLARWAGVLVRGRDPEQRSAEPLLITGSWQKLEEVGAV